MRRWRANGGGATLGFAWACACLAWGARASAEPRSSRPDVTLEPGACDATPIALVGSALRVELLGRLIEGAPEGAYRAAVRCEGDVVSITVAAPPRPPRLVQTNLARAPANVRPRIVALAIAELVRDLDRDADAAPPPPAPSPIPIPAPVTPPAPPPSVAADDSRRPLVELGLFGAASRFGSSAPLLVGGGVRFEYGYRWLSVGLDTGLLTASERFAEGTARVFVGYGAPQLAWRGVWGRSVETRLGVGDALGAASLRGRTTDPQALAGTTTGAWNAPYAFGALAARIAGILGVEARGQAGAVTLPVVGEVAGARAIAIKGAWLSAGVGMTLAL